MSRHKSIDLVVAEEEVAKRNRASEEVQRRVDLAQKLGDRAMEGEPFGLKGFMAIGFPKLTPESKQYQDRVEACNAIKRIAKGQFIKVGDVLWGGIVGVKTDSEDKGLSFSVRRWADGSHYVQANVLCSRAIYENGLAGSVTYGTDEEPYPVHFIDTSISEHNLLPVRAIILGSCTESGRVQYTDGSMAGTDMFTERLVTELTAV